MDWITTLREVLIAHSPVEFEEGIIAGEQL
jgi:hypothetical protein